MKKTEESRSSREMKAALLSLLLSLAVRQSAAHAHRREKERERERKKEKYRDKTIFVVHNILKLY